MIRQPRHAIRAQRGAMFRTQLASMGNAFTVRIAGATLPVSGSSEAGWDIAFEHEVSQSYRYGTLDELAFVLINLSVADDGSA
jgi:hypothetical protein